MGSVGWGEGQRADWVRRRVDWGGDLRASVFPARQRIYGEENILPQNLIHSLNVVAYPMKPFVT
jgi:hypothetical protein